VDERWPSKEGEYAFTLEAVLERGRECRRWLKGREEKCIAVVSHSGFLRVGVSNRRFANADFRVFDFAEEDDGEARLVEWEFTERNGGGLGKSEKGEGGTNIH
jgi:broad specificity phosphatase PhoE